MGEARGDEEGGVVWVANDGIRLGTVRMNGLPCGIGQCAALWINFGGEYYGRTY